jgi:hypothetical protein
MEGWFFCGAAAGLPVWPVLPGLAAAGFPVAGAVEGVGAAPAFSFFNPSLSIIWVNRLMVVPFSGFLL